MCQLTWKHIFFSYQKQERTKKLRLIKRYILITFQNTQKQTKVLQYNEALKLAYFKGQLLQVVATIISKQ